MPFKNTMTSYGSVTKFFHWLIFLLLFFMIIYGFFLDDFPKSYQPLTYNIHKLIGLLILVLMIMRGTWALFNVKPPLPFNISTWQRWAERSVHLALYFFVFAMPLAGWIGSSAAGRLPHLGPYALALKVPQNKSLVETSFYLHNKIAFVLIALFCIHAGAALYHQFVRKDDILKRMLPTRS